MGLFVSGGMSEAAVDAAIEAYAQPLNANLTSYANAADAAARRALIGVAPEVEVAVADVDGATVTMDYAAGRVHKVTLGGNRTIAFSNFADGGTLRIFLFQDSPGSRTVTWPTITWAGGSPPTLTTTANKADCIVVTKVGSVIYGAVAMANL